MDIYFWLGVVGMLVFGLTLVQGIRRARTHDTARLDQLLGLTNTINIPHDHPYIAALRSGDPAVIAKAPLPEFFSEELLLQGLYRVQNQPSLYDLFLERIAQQFTLGQHKKLISKWTAYGDTLGKGTESYNTFLHRMSERPDLHREYDKRESTYKADIAAEELREAQSQRSREKLWEPEPSPLQPRRKKTREDLKVEEIKRFEGVVAGMDARGVLQDAPERKLEKNIHEDRMRRIILGEPLDPL